MITLFEKYKNSEKLQETLLIGQNMFNKNPGDRAVFEAYFSYLCNLAEKLDSPSDKSRFAEQAGVVLAFYSENANLDDDTIAFITKQRERIDEINLDLDNKSRSEAEKYAKEMELANNQTIKKLYALKHQLLYPICVTSYYIFIKRATANR